MKWESGRRSTNIEDIRDRQPPQRAKIGCAGLVVVLVLAICCGVNPLKMSPSRKQAPSATERESNRKTPRNKRQSQRANADERPAAPGSTRSAAENELADFVSVVLADTEDTWNPLFRRMGKTYEEPTLVLFSKSVRSACGFQTAATGPFYCSRDKKAYIDLAFYDAMKKKLGAPGDFAQAYVIAHEVGHHVQNLLGTSADVRKMKMGKKKQDRNQLTVRQELQADCFAGIWAYHAKKARNVVEAGDVEEALGAASAIGDDRLQMRSGGHVRPETFTHGTSAQRVRWFKKGFQSGRVESCDTLSAKRL